MSNIGVSLTHMSASLICIDIGIPLLLGKIKMNTYYVSEYQNHYYRKL